MVLSSAARRLVVLTPLLAKHRRSFATTPISRTREALRVLFCGSDAFSIASLRALNHERLGQAAKDSGIESIHVVCRPGKRTGRGLKKITHPPIRSVAEDLHLPIHEIDTFTGWKPPTSVNLVIAVSFGLLVPSRILGSAKYGGLNVHPSLLPDLRGAAPLEHTLLQRRKYTGVSLQTLHPTKFDHGEIISRTPYPRIPIAVNATPKDLLDTLAPLGAEMLVQAIRDRAFEPHYDGKPSALSESEITEMTGGKGVALAPKIRPVDRRICWNEDMTIDEILLRDRVLGRLWDDSTYAEAVGEGQPKRVVYDSWTHDLEGNIVQEVHLDDQRAIVAIENDGKTTTLSAHVKLITGPNTGEGLYSSAFTIDGGKKNAGVTELAKAMQRSGRLNKVSR